MSRTRELDERLRAVNARAIELTEALLLLSRADKRSFAREHLDLSLIAEEATETLIPLTEQRGLTIETSGDTTPTIGSPALAIVRSSTQAHDGTLTLTPPGRWRAPRHGPTRRVERVDLTETVAVAVHGVASWSRATDEVRVSAVLQASPMARSYAARDS